MKGLDMDENKKINIGLFIDVFFPMVDGVVVVVDNYARLLSKYANVTVFAPKSRDKEHKDIFDYKVVRSKQVKVLFTDYDFSLPLFDFKFRKKLRNSNLDIVHIHSPFSIGHAGIKYAKKHNIPLIATLHSQYKKDFLERTKSEVISDLAVKEIMKTFNQCDDLWAVNSKVSEIFIEYGAQKQPTVQLNATDLKPYQNEKEESKLKKKYQINQDEKLFLYVGRLDAVKNLDFTLEVLYKLRLKEYKFKMIFIGTGPFLEEMKKKIKKYGLSSMVIFAGKIMDRNELALHYKIADLFLFPSLYDSSSLVQIEAASQKTPSLFIRGAATAQTVTEDVNGYLSDDDPSVYAKKIIEIFKNSRQYKNVCEQAYKDLYKTWEHTTVEVYNKYLELIKQKGPRK
jgi:glycosyltransferase involved in cell wall biosynthesis